MQKSLTQIFNETAAAAHDAFPLELNNLVVLLVSSSDTPVYSSPTIADQLTKRAAAVKKAVKKLSNMMQAENDVGFAKNNYKLAGTTANLIALVKNPGGIFSGPYTEEMDLISTLDHEIGHHIVENGFASSVSAQQQAESAADAYAMLRHIQRFGKNTEQAGHYAELATAHIILFSDAAHYTSDAAQRVFELAKKTDVRRLSLRETAKLAGKIAAEFYLDKRTLRKICRAFLPVRKACKMYIGTNHDVLMKLRQEDKKTYALLCREILAVMHKHQNDPDIFKAGKLFLSYPARKNFMTESAKTDPYWQGALTFIDHPEMTAPKKLSASRLSAP